MQKNGKKKPAIVQKPIMHGAWSDKLARKRALRVTGSILMTVFIYLVFGSMLMIENLILRVLANCALVLLSAGFLYMTGAGHGEADAAFSEIMYQRDKEGKNIPEADRARCFHPLKGLFTAALGAAPYFLLALILALTAQIQTYTLGALPSWLDAYRRQAEIGNPLSYYSVSVSMGVLDYVRLGVRVLILPYVSMVGSGNASLVLLVERLSPLLVLIVPSGYALGYYKGKSLRDRVHTSIAQNKRRKKRKDMKEKQKRQQKGPEQLI